MASSRLNSRSLAVNDFPKFNVHIKTMSGNMITIECNSRMSISSLTDKLLEALPEDNKDMIMGATLTLPTLSNNGEVTGYELLHPSDLLGDKGIVNNTTLDAVYKDIFSNMSCIHPFPEGQTFSQNLHRWIEAQPLAESIGFNPPFEREEVVRQRMEAVHVTQFGLNGPPIIHPISGYTSNKTHTANRNTTLLLNHNNWNWDKDTVFTLSNSQTLAAIGMPEEQNFVSHIMNSNVSYAPFNPFHKIRYNTGAENDEGNNDVEVPNHSYIRGVLRAINITINNTYFRAHSQRPDHYERRYHISVLLSSPITIRNKNGDEVLHSFTHENATCLVPYEMILMCDADGNLPNSMNELEAPNSGGRRRRTKTSKRTKKSKRTKNKRKTRSR
jgi:hypothetical protein